jgi:hypothetical protein
MVHPIFGQTNLSKTHRAPNPKDSQLIAQLLQRRCIDEIHRFAERPRATRPQVEHVEMAVGQNLVPLVNIKIAGKWM